MVFASQNADLATLSAPFLDDWIRSVPTNVQEGFQFLLPVANDEKLVTGNFEVHELSDFFESQRMGDTHPAFREDRSLLKFEQALFPIPRCGKGIHCWAIATSACTTRVDAAHIGGDLNREIVCCTGKETATSGAIAKWF
jgi:hypothetical protein